MQKVYKKGPWVVRRRDPSFNLILAVLHRAVTLVVLAAHPL